ncbi:MAG: NAD-glutamate dehydrogenase [Pseudomonadota bacterium]
MSGNQARIEEITALVLREMPVEQRPLVESFVYTFFKRKKYIDLNTLPTEVIVQILQNLWYFFAERLPGENKVEVVEVADPDSFGNARTIINILTENKPFLADSFLGILRQEGIVAHIFISPLYDVSRNESGQPKSVDVPSSLEKKNSFEALLHCEILQPIDKKQVALLRDKIVQTLQDVALAVRDWKAMRACVSGTAQMLQVPGFSEDQAAEVREFLKWIENNHFTFLGFREYDFQKPKITSFEESVVAKSSLGILQASHHEDTGILYHGINLQDECVSFLYHKDPVIVSKTNRFSPVHRNVPMDSISIKIFDSKGKVVGLRQFLGLFTSVAYSSSALDIPLLRHKVLTVVKQAGFSPEWHDGKALLHVLDTLPRDELFQAAAEELMSIGVKVLSLQEEPRVALFIRKDNFNRFLSCFVFIPRDRFDYELIEQLQRILQRELGYTVTLSSARYGGLSFARVHYIAATEGQEGLQYDVKVLEQLLIQAAESWEDQLQTELQNQLKQPQAATLFAKYEKAFDKGYQVKTAISEVVIDIRLVEKTVKAQQPFVRVFRLPQDKDYTVRLKLYHTGEAYLLSDILDKLTNMDLHILYEARVHVVPQGDRSVWIHDIAAKSRERYPVALEAVTDKFQEAFLRVLQGDIENDGFNRLVLRSTFSWRQCLLMRAFCKYLHQIQIPFRQTYIEETLVKHGEITQEICQLFFCRFDPVQAFERKACEVNTYKGVRAKLDQIQHPDEDRILRSLANLVMATVRSNFFHVDAEGKPMSYLSFKFESERIEELPLPRPMYEIFIYSIRFEAVHLRGGKVARGGIRWSDRREDFRTEILGLVKAQMVKNSVIVPVGAKGGFVVKTNLEQMDRTEAKAEGQACYQEMVKAMLEITDNLVAGEVKHPLSTFCYDEDDPYFVVAADKGTATFSDYANAIAQKQNFWLDDAFASGGKTGYDHKKMGITAKGAWESVRQHFWAHGRDIEKESIAVVGIGSMAGDVFGNGMLLSPHLKLLAAISYRSIFIDPNPDPEISFKERHRLFGEVLGWEHYNQDLLSRGGAVYEKTSKQVHLTPEIRHWLQLGQETITPAQLIQNLLKSQYDLFWLGGVGTYVKSSRETHAQVGDRSNDAYRVNADELRCRVVGEGANLGLTQNARIEFARAGGCINNDAVDNAGGVDCSDHEVNIKILLQDVVEQGKLSLTQRDQLLEQMTDEVEHLVLQSNQYNNLALALAQSRASHILERDARLMRHLEKKGVLNRQLEFLPDDVKLTEYQKSGVGLTRPERAVLFAYSKNDLFNEIIKTQLPDDSLLEFELRNYFPKVLQEKYLPEILRHPLRREIVATMAVNRLINFMGSAFSLELAGKLGRPSWEIVQGFYLVLHLYGFHNLIESIKELETKLTPENQIKCLSQIRWRIKRTVIWFLGHRVPFLTDALMQKFETNLAELQQHIQLCLTTYDKEQLLEMIKRYRSFGLSELLARQMAEIELIAASSDILLIAEDMGVAVVEVARVYFAVGTRFAFNDLRSQASNLWSKTSWQRLAIHGIFEDFSFAQDRLTRQVLQYFQAQNKAVPDSGPKALEIWQHHVSDAVAHVDGILKDTQALPTADLAVLSVAQRELRMFTEKVS